MDDVRALVGEHGPGQRPGDDVGELHHLQAAQLPALFRGHA
ncbi:hypothetical protein ABGB14_38500 [Nonomuraea sp. B10E15]